MITEQDIDLRVFSEGTFSFKVGRVYTDCPDFIELQLVPKGNGTIMPLEDVRFATKPQHGYPYIKAYNSIVGFGGIRLPVRLQITYISRDVFSLLKKILKMENLEKQIDYLIKTNHKIT